YEYENDLGDRDVAYATLQAWLAPAADAKTSASETPIVEAATRRLAELDIERGDYELALQHCAASRAARPGRETHGVEAVRPGGQRPARHRLEDFIAGALFPIEAAVGRVLDSSA